MQTSCHIRPRILKEPFKTSLRTVTNFDVIEFIIETDDGLLGYGDAVETPVITGDTQEMILDDLDGPLRRLLLARTFTSPTEVATDIANLPVVASAKAAAEMALYDLQSARENGSLALTLGSAELSVRSDITIPISNLDRLPTLVQKRLNDGFRTFKVKLGLEPIDISIEKLELVRDLAGESSLIRIDPNQAWSIPHTLAFLEEAENQGIPIDYLEQPTPAHDKAALAQIRRNTAVRIMADESCFAMEDLQELIELDAVDLVNIKLLKCGGITSALEMGKVALDAGIGVLIGSMMEGDRGVYTAACLASALAPREIHDLDASWWATESEVKYRDGKLLLI